jgi:uncharacterized protein YjbI with pentapeptide repeats
MPWANLQGAILTNANLFTAHCPWANLTGADLTGADLRGINMAHAVGDVKDTLTPEQRLLLERGIAA